MNLTPLESRRENALTLSVRAWLVRVVVINDMMRRGRMKGIREEEPMSLLLCCCPLHEGKLRSERASERERERERVACTHDDPKT